jgi:predicted acylesterase/phospholipase RssA
MDSHTRQLRLALSMNGGVSLAVWIGGAVCEIDELRRSFDDCSTPSFWRDLATACGYNSVQVDVMTGASAGGLNGVLMAEAIRTGTPYSQFRSLWEQAADIDQLIKHPRTALRHDRRSVLRGGYFVKMVEEALQLGEPTTLDHDLEVFASATVLTSHQVKMYDSPGLPIAEHRSDGYFHVARRGHAGAGLDGFAADDNRAFLARVGRATSSLPGLFEPVRFDAGTANERLVGGFVPGTATSEIIDGGVIDNVPIARAIRAIAQSKSDCAVRRVLLYLHPDPSIRGERSSPRSALGVVGRFSSKRKENIREDIDLLREHNAAAKLRNAMADSLRVGVGRPHDEQAYLRARSEADRALLLRAAVEPAAELPWHAVGVPRLTPVIDYASTSIRQLRRSLTNNSWDSWRIAGVTHRRVIATLHRMLQSVEGSAFDGAYDCKKRLYEIGLVADLVVAYQVAAFVHPRAATADQRIVRLREARCRLERADLSAPAAISQIARWSDEPMPEGAGATRHLDGVVGSLIDTLRPYLDLGGSVDGEALIEHLDAVFIPLTAVAVASDQPISFNRIAGSADTPAARAFVAAGANPQHKLAGWQLGHTGAFFSTKWRTNDWMWGRLDATCGLIDTLIDGEVPTAVLDTFGLPPGSSHCDVKAALCERRQLEILGGWLTPGQPPPSSMAALQRSAGFREWARHRRTIGAHLGTRRMTSATMRCLLAAWKVTVGNGVKGWLLSPLRSVLLAVGGIALAGRRATVGLTASVAVMAAVRAGGLSGWITWAAGAALAAAVLLIVETKLRPGMIGAVWYPVSLLILAFGAWALGRRNWLLAAEWFGAGVRVWWTIPLLAATLSVWMMVFWMKRWVGALLSVGTGAVYGLAAWLAMPGSDGAAHRVDLWWPRSLWVVWLFSVVAVPAVIAQLSNEALGGPKLLHDDVPTNGAV